jgi:hypothetical protein
MKLLGDNDVNKYFNYSISIVANVRVQYFSSHQVVLMDVDGWER